jgi:hypothetical protein
MLIAPELPLLATSLTRRLETDRATFPVAELATLNEIFATVPPPETGEPDAIATRKTPPDTLDETENDDVSDPAVTDGEVNRTVSYAIRNSMDSMPETESTVTGTVTCCPQ